MADTNERILKKIGYIFRHDNTESLVVQGGMKRRPTRLLNRWTDALADLLTKPILTILTIPLTVQRELRKEDA